MHISSILKLLKLCTNFKHLLNQYLHLSTCVPNFTIRCPLKIVFPVKGPEASVLRTRAHTNATTITRDAQNYTWDHNFYMGTQNGSKLEI